MDETKRAAWVAAAERLRTARETGKPCAPLRETFEATSEQDGYAVQEVNTEYWLDQGRRLIGRKIGLTSRAVQTQLGVHQPDYGMLWSDMSFLDAEVLPTERLIQPRVEAEIAFVLGQSLDTDVTAERLIGAVEYAVVALEVVDSAVRDWDIRFVDTVADNASSGIYVLGSQRRKLDGLDLRSCGMVMERRGEVVATGAGAACLGHPLTATLWLARKMVEVGRPLREGDLVLSGALGPLVPVEAGDVVETRVQGLGAVRAVFGGNPS